MSSPSSILGAFTAVVASMAVLALTANLSLAEADLRDPTRPPEFKGTRAEVQPSEQRDFRLSAILVAKGRRVAVINGIPVRAGDRVVDTEVESILRDRVILQTSEGELVLKLIPDLAYVSDRGEGI